MKHIEDYKLFKESSSREDLPYQEISRSEFIRTVSEWDDFDEDYVINSNWAPFTQNELEKIQEMIPDAKYNMIVETDPDVENARICSLKYNATIIKLIDEWYYVMVYSSNKPQFFKCDQFDGLIELIKNVIYYEYLLNLLKNLTG